MMHIECTFGGLHVRDSWQNTPEEVSGCRATFDLRIRPLAHSADCIGGRHDNSLSRAYDDAASSSRRIPFHDEHNSCWSQKGKALQYRESRQYFRSRDRHGSNTVRSFCRPSQAHLEVVEWRIVWWVQKQSGVCPNARCKGDYNGLLGRGFWQKAPVTQTPSRWGNTAIHRRMALSFQMLAMSPEKYCAAWRREHLQRPDRADRCCPCGWSLSESSIIHVRHPPSSFPSSKAWERWTASVNTTGIVTDIHYPATLFQCRRLRTRARRISVCWTKPSTIHDSFTLMKKSTLFPARSLASMWPVRNHEQHSPWSSAREIVVPGGSAIRHQFGARGGARMVLAYPEAGQEKMGNRLWPLNIVQRSYEGSSEGTF